MKKKFLTVLGILLLVSFANVSDAKTTISGDLANAIKLYKNGNYSECYTNLQEVIKKDSANALAYYYLAISSAQVGRKDEAVSNYEKAILLSPKHSNLNRYAVKGKTCLENHDKCDNGMYESPVDAFIQSKKATKLSDEVKSDFERLKIENLMREINRTGDIDPQKFRDYKDFSSMNTDVQPSNDEIVNALRVLHKAGLSDYSNNSFSDLSLLLGSEKSNSLYGMSDSSTLNPHIIQAMLANKMSLGF